MVVDGRPTVHSWAIHYPIFIKILFECADTQRSIDYSALPLPTTYVQDMLSQPVTRWVLPRRDHGGKDFQNMPFLTDKHVHARNF